MEVVGTGLTGAADAPSGASAQKPRSPLAERAAALLNKRCRIEVQDGRMLVGNFYCLDREGNIILSNTMEVMTLDGRLCEKHMGQVLVPLAHRKTCAFQATSPGEQDELQVLLQAPSAHAQ